MAEYCPFLNCADERCSGHFNLDGLEQAFAHCFGDFAACPHHGELTRERAAERARDEEADGRYNRCDSPDSPSPIQLTVSARRRKRLAAAA